MGSTGSMARPFKNNYSSEPQNEAFRADTVVPCSEDEEESDMGVAGLTKLSLGLDKLRQTWEKKSKETKVELTIKHVYIFTMYAEVNRNKRKR
ncbi:hypothetical protein AC249_AIPGENE19289 [Exaiptasia diaphana]|nr:hypothetical protein AC249_AIPGENE19289 [Exaiptasia diaphana]